MIQGNFSNQEVDGDDFEGEDMNIDSSQQDLMFDILFKQMYRKPIASIVREITSNCFDSHIEAKVDDPVVISFQEDEGGEYISFKDVGIGISPDRMSKVYSRPLKSTKRDSNEQIGFFGLGSKSPFSYTDNFFLTTVSEGIKYEYLIHRGKSKPRIDKLSEDSTDEHNGSEVKIYFKNTIDKNAFSEALHKELCYFDNVYFDNIPNINNQYQIYEYKTFKLRTDLKYSNDLHICIGKVCYPINWEEIGIKSIPLSFGLRFEIGELPITPERESVRYINILNDNEEIVTSTKETLLKRIAEFREELQNLYDEQNEEDLDDLLEYIHKRHKDPILEVAGTNFNLNKIVRAKTIKYLPLKDFHGSIPENPIFEWGIKAELYKGRKIREKDSNWTLGLATLTSALCLRYPESGKLNRVKTEYFYDFAEQQYKSPSFSLIVYHKFNKTKDILNHLGLYKEKWRSFDYSKTNLLKQIQLYRKVINSEVKRLSFNYDTFEVPDDWLDAYKKAHKRQVLKKEDEILVYDYGLSQTTDSKTYVNPEAFAKYTGFIIYGTEDEERTIRAWRHVISASKYGGHTILNDVSYIINPKKCRLFKMAKRNEKYFLTLPHAVHVEQFMSDNKIFRRFATAAMAVKESKALRLTGHYAAAAPGNQGGMNFREALGYVFTPAHIALENLQKDVKDFGKGAFAITENPERFSEDTIATITELREDIIDVAKSHDLYDKEMLANYNRLEKFAKGLDLVNHIVINENSLHLLADFIILKGKPVNNFWKDKTTFEYELIQDSISKLKYLENILEDPTNVQKKQADRLYSYQDKYNKRVNECKQSLKYLNNINKYHEEREAERNQA